MRGRSSHGWGSKKKHRGAGNRGGRGMAGSGKRAGQKKPSIQKYFGINNYFGRKGFTSRRTVVTTLNITDLNTLAVKGELTAVKGLFEVDLTKLGADKLLAKGSPKFSFHLLNGIVTPKAREKIINSKGRVDTEVLEEENEVN